MDEKLRELVEKSGYTHFTFVNKPIPFNDMYRDNDIEIVELVSAGTYELKGEKGIVGFCGKFKWLSNKIISLDYDTYNEDMLVLGYHWFKNKEDIDCLSLLVGNDW